MITSNKKKKNYANKYLKSILTNNAGLSALSDVIYAHS